MSLQNEKKIRVHFEDGSKETIEFSDDNIIQVQEIIAATNRDYEQIMQVLIDIANKKYGALKEAAQQKKTSPPMTYKSMFLDQLEQYKKHPTKYLEFLNRILAIHIDGKDYEEIYGDDACA